MVLVLPLIPSSDNVYLVRGRDKDRPAWYYVSVDRLKLPLFLKALQEGVIHLEHYSNIMYSGWGYTPPECIRQKVKEKYVA